MKCVAEGRHWSEVRPCRIKDMGDIPLCRKHELIFLFGGRLNFTAKLKTKEWRLGILK